MAKAAVSVTLDEQNLLWLRGQAGAGKRGNLSEALDALIAEARSAGRVPDDAVRSVVGTIDIAAGDPDLDRADADLRRLVDDTLRRPLLVRERRPEYGRGRSRPPGRPRRG